MFLKQDTPYAAAAPVRVKCVAKYVSTRAESSEVVDGVVAMKASELMAACALSDGEVCVVAHLKDDDCHRLEEGQSYFIKHYNLTGRCFSIIFKTSSVVVSSALDVMCHHAVCPPSKLYEDTCSADGYYTLEGHVIRLSTTRLQDTRNGPVPLQYVTVQCGRSQIEAALWREAALTNIALGERRAITQLQVQRRGKLNSTSYTEVKKMEIVFRSGDRRLPAGYILYSWSASFVLKEPNISLSPSILYPVLFCPILFKLITFWVLTLEVTLDRALRCLTGDAAADQSHMHRGVQRPGGQVRVF
ncbi:hypothetical protein SRHO_G00033610 [Serrasalmus rhombeus]